MARLDPPFLISVLGFNPTGDVGPYTIYTSKRKRIVVFLKAPPTKPPTRRQQIVRNQFRITGWSWSRQTPDVRANWQNAARRSGAKITGYNLYQFYNATGNAQVIRMIERQSGTNLI